MDISTSTYLSAQFANKEFLFPLVQTMAQMFAALGTVFLGLIAVFGHKILTPKLRLKLLSNEGELTTLSDGHPVHYFHLEVTNGKFRKPANRLKVYCSGQSKKSNGAFEAVRFVAGIPLTWVPAEVREFHSNVHYSDQCDLGRLKRRDGANFEIMGHYFPNSSLREIKAGEIVRLSLIAKGENYISPTPLILEISWDGKWDGELKNHLKIEEVKSLI